MMQMMMQQQADRNKSEDERWKREDREHRNEEWEAQRESQHSELLRSLQRQGDPSPTASSDNTTVVARPREPLPHMGEKDDLKEYISTFELQIPMSDIPAEQ